MKWLNSIVIHIPGICLPIDHWEASLQTWRKDTGLVRATFLRKSGQLETRMLFKSDGAGVLEVLASKLLSLLKSWPSNRLSTR